MQIKPRHYLLLDIYVKQLLKFIQKEENTGTK